MNKKGFSAEFKVGIFGLIALGFFIFLAIQLGRAHSEVKGKQYFLVFNFLNGLQEGSAVKYSGGILVGKVSSIEPFGDKAKLSIVVNDKIHVDTRTTFSIMSNGLLGEKYINVSLAPSEDGQTPQALPEGSEIIGKEDIGFDKLISGVTQLAAEMSKVMTPLAQIVAKLDQSNEIPKLLESLKRLIENGNLLIGDNGSSIQKILSDAQLLMNKVVRGQGTISKILNDRALAQSVSDTLDNINILISRISRNPLIGGSGR